MSTIFNWPCTSTARRYFRSARLETAVCTRQRSAPTAILLSAAKRATALREKIHRLAVAILPTKPAANLRIA